MWHLPIVSAAGQHGDECGQCRNILQKKVGNALLTFYYSRLHRAVEDNRRSLNVERKINFKNL